MIDLQNETLIQFSEAAAKFPGRPNLSTLHRWRLRGVRGGVKLESCLVGGKRFTSHEALQRFSDALAAGDQPAPIPTTLSKGTARAHQQAERELNAAGI